MSARKKSVLFQSIPELVEQELPYKYIYIYTYIFELIIYK